MGKMKVCAMLNNKGGVGKTASITTLSDMIAHRGKRVLVVDLDPQGNTSGLFNPDMDFYNMFLNIWNGEWKNKEIYSVEDALMDTKLDVHKCIIRTNYENLDILPSYLTLAEVENRLQADITTPQQFRLRKQLEKVEDEYDFCLIDCSPSINILNINGLVAADEVYIPTRTDGNSCLGIAISYNLINTVQSYNPRLKVAGIFFTQFNKNKRVSRETFKFLYNVLPENVLLPIFIGTSKLLEQNSFQAEPLLELDSKKNPSSVTESYWKLADYIMAEDRESFLSSDRLKSEREFIREVLEEE